MKPLESQAGSKSDIFVSTFLQAKAYTDHWANLNFIVKMKKIGGQPAAASSEPAPQPAEVAEPVASTSAAADAADAAAAAAVAAPPAAVAPAPVEEAMA